MATKHLSLPTIMQCHTKKVHLRTDHKETACGIMEHHRTRVHLTQYDHN